MQLKILEQGVTSDDTKTSPQYIEEDARTRADSVVFYGLRSHSADPEAQGSGGVKRNSTDAESEEVAKAGIRPGAEQIKIHAARPDMKVVKAPV